MKKLVLIIFLAGCGSVFGAFEFDILGQLAATTSFPIAESKTTKINGSTEVRPNLSLQLGYQFPMTNTLKGISVFADIRIEQTIIGLTFPGNSKTVTKKSALNLGVGLTSKFIFGSVNSLVPRDTILGFGVGIKIVTYAPDIIFTTSIPAMSPYLDVFVEQRFFVSRKLALVGGINVGVDMLIFQSTDISQLFNGMYISAYPSLSIGLSIGLHFGN